MVVARFPSPFTSFLYKHTRTLRTVSLSVSHSFPPLFIIFSLKTFSHPAFSSFAFLFLFLYPSPSSSSSQLSLSFLLTVLFHFSCFFVFFLLSSLCRLFFISLCVFHARIPPSPSTLSPSFSFSVCVCVCVLCLFTHSVFGPRVPFFFFVFLSITQVSSA